MKNKAKDEAIAANKSYAVVEAAGCDCAASDDGRLPPPEPKPIDPIFNDLLRITRDLTDRCHQHEDLRRLKDFEIEQIKVRLLRAETDLDELSSRMQASPGASAIVFERYRSIAPLDAKGEFLAAAAYLIREPKRRRRNQWPSSTPPTLTLSRRAELIAAGALIAAEIDRLDHEETEDHD